jgi:hypothetical protein
MSALDNSITIPDATVDTLKLVGIATWQEGAIQCLALELLSLLVNIAVQHDG